VKRRLVLLGAPGSGKGTQAEMITRQFGIPVTSTGAILRRERDLGTPLGQETAEVLQSGGLVSDKIIIELSKTGCVCMVVTDSSSMVFPEHCGRPKV